MPENATEWFGMRVTPSRKAQIKQLAEREGTTQKDAVLKAIERELAADDQEHHGSVLDVTEDLCGAAEGPPDLSRNLDHMEDYGKD